MANQLLLKIGQLIKPEFIPRVVEYLSMLYWNTCQYNDLLNIYTVDFQSGTVIMVDYQINLDEGDFASILIYLPSENPLLFSHFFNLHNIYQNINWELHRKNCQGKTLDLIQSIRQESINYRDILKKNMNAYQNFKSAYFENEKPQSTGQNMIQPQKSAEIAFNHIKDFFEKKVVVEKKELTFDDKLKSGYYLSHDIENEEIKKLIIKDLTIDLSHKMKVALVEKTRLLNKSSTIHSEITLYAKELNQKENELSNKIGQLQEIKARLSSYKEELKLETELSSSFDDLSFEDFLDKVIQVEGQTFHEFLKSNSFIQHASREESLNDLNRVLKKLFEKGLLSFDLSIKLIREVSRQSFYHQYMKSKK